MPALCCVDNLQAAFASSTSQLDSLQSPVCIQAQQQDVHVCWAAKIFTRHGLNRGLGWLGVFCSSSCVQMLKQNSSHNVLKPPVKGERRGWLGLWASCLDPVQTLEDSTQGKSKEGKPAGVSLMHQSTVWSNLSCSQGSSIWRPSSKTQS